jgi:DNA-binding transcriptional regulator YiaG
MAKKPGIWDKVIDGLEDLVQCLEQGQPLEDRFVVRKVLVRLQPRKFSAADVRRLRARLGMSQQVFARLLAVSSKTVQLWEAKGAQTPMSRRLLEAIEPWWAAQSRSAEAPRRRKAS